MSYKQPSPVAPADGGTGVNNATRTITIAGNLATSGANPLTLTTTGSTNVTLPTSGTLATTSQIPAFPLTVANGGTGVGTLTAHGVLIGEGTSNVAITSAGSAGQHLQSGGASADPNWTTATFPATATSTGTILRADGTNWSATTATYPATTTVSQILYSSSTNVIGGITTANNGVMQTNSSGVPSISIPTSTTYTPTIGDGTNNFVITSGGSSNGFYWQIGRYYFVNIAIVWTGKGSASAGSQIQISLPATSGTVPTRSSFTLGYVSNVTAAGMLTFNVNSSSNQIQGWVFVSGGGPNALTVGNFGTTGEIQFAGWFSV